MQQLAPAQELKRLILLQQVSTVGLEVMASSLPHVGQIMRLSTGLYRILHQGCHALAAGRGGGAAATSAADEVQVRRGALRSPL